ncbi:MAG TPA: LysE family translocator [Steroidobacteraceae bacterium]|nr:LysE family translocator [Steroidobacteraceae bacterium]
MSPSNLVIFALVYAVAVAAPGPGVAAVIARGLGRGLRGAPAFIAGFLVGDLVWFTLAVLGLAILAQKAHVVFVAVRYAGALYLLYLAWRLWIAPPRPLAEGAMLRAQQPLEPFIGSLALALGNPKTMVFFLAVLPTVVDLKRLGIGGFCAIAAVFCCVLPAVLGAYTVLAARARARFADPEALRWLQRGTGAVMAGAALAVATR